MEEDFDFGFGERAFFKDFEGCVLRHSDEAPDAVGIVSVGDIEATGLDHLSHCSRLTPIPGVTTTFRETPGITARQLMPLRRGQSLGTRLNMDFTVHQSLPGVPRCLFSIFSLAGPMWARPLC